MARLSSFIGVLVSATLLPLGLGFGLELAPAGAQLPAYDLALAKISPTMPVAANGDDIAWTVRVQNQGAVNSGAFSVSDTLPAGTSYIAGSGRFMTGGAAGSALGTPAASFTGVNGTFTFTNATGLVPGGYVDIGFSVNVDDINKAPFRNWAEISFDSGNDDDSTPDTNTGSGSAFPNDGYSGVVDLAALAIDGAPGAEPTGTTDADDNDDAVVRRVAPDLALRTTVTSFDGKRARFTVEVFNQGVGPVDAIDVTDYVDPAVWESFNPAENASTSTGASSGTVGGRTYASPSVALGVLWNATDPAKPVAVLSGVLKAGE